MTITAGLTGGICVGKSNVAKTFRKHGIVTVDADLIARDVVQPGCEGMNRILNAFGGAFLNSDRTLDRVKFGAFIFKDKQARKMLDSLMLPLIASEAKKQIDQLHKDGHSIVIYDAALIIEMGHADHYRPLVVVVCPEDIQLERLMTRNKLTKEEAISRIDSQIPANQKALMADYVIDTSRDIKYSIEQTINIIQELKDLDSKRKLF